VDLRLSGKSVVVTGSTRGIGNAIAEAFLNEDARVMLTGRNSEVLEQARDILMNRFGQNKVNSFVGDLTDDSKILNLVEAVQSVFGGLDILVCNIGGGRSVPPLQEDGAEWHRMLRINLLSATTTVRSFLPLLEKSPNDAAIILISSICGLQVFGAPVTYSVAKAALNAFARNIAVPLGRKGVRVNAICPGNVMFEGSTWERKIAEDPSAVKQMLQQDVPLGRFGTPKEIADLTVFLASPRAACGKVSEKLKPL